MPARSASASAWKKLACTKNRAENVHYLTRLSISSGKQPGSFAIAKWRRTVKRTSKVSAAIRWGTFGQVYCTRSKDINCHIDDEWRSSCRPLLLLFANSSRNRYHHDLGHRIPKKRTRAKFNLHLIYFHIAIMSNLKKNKWLNYVE